VTSLPPSIVVSFETGTSAVTVIVTGADPQSNVTTPPPATAAASDFSVQLAAVPVPTTAVGFETSTALAGRSHVAAGGAGAAPSKPEPLLEASLAPSLDPEPDPEPAPELEAPELEAPELEPELDPLDPTPPASPAPAGDDEPPPHATATTTGTSSNPRMYPRVPEAG